MKISIVTASFNQAQFLGDCIESVGEAKVRNDVEYIVADGGSTDGSVKVIRQYEHVVDAWWSESDEGPPSALNKGFRQSSGDIYGYINADDYYFARACEKVYRIFRENPGVDVVYGHGVMVDEHKRHICEVYSDVWSIERALYGRCSVVQQGTFFRAEAFRRAGGFNEKNVTCWDGELLADMALNGAQFYRIEEMLGAFRIHEDSISGSGRLEDEYREDRKRIRRNVVGKESSLATKIKARWFGLIRAVKEPGLLVRRIAQRVRRKLYWWRHGG